MYIYYIACVMETPKARIYMRARQHWIDITTYESHFVIKLYTRSLHSTIYVYTRWSRLYAVCIYIHMTGESNSQMNRVFIFYFYLF